MSSIFKRAKIVVVFFSSAWLKIRTFVISTYTADIKIGTFI